MRISVDFGKPLRPVSPLAFGTAEEAYGSASAGDLDTDPVHRERFAALRLDQMRFNLMVADPGQPSGPFVCAASGCRGFEGDVSADGYIQKMRQLGVEPVATLMLVPGDIALSATVAANMVRHYQQLGTPIRRWVIDNEPDLPSHGGVGTHTRELSPEEYSRYFDAVHDAMKAVDPSVLVGGPATSSLNEVYFREFFARSAARVGFIDFHGYADWMGSRSEAQLLAETPRYAAEIERARELFREAAPARADTIDLQLGEWNYDAGPPEGDPRAASGFSVVWGASALGHILRAGGLSVTFANKDPELGLLFWDEDDGGRPNDPKPLYHALGMYTGEGLFRRFGSTLVAATSSVPEVEVFASNGEKNLVLVNKSATRYAATVSLVGVDSGRVEPWSIEKARVFDGPPTKGEPVTVSGGGFKLSLPPWSVTTLVVDP